MKRIHEGKLRTVWLSGVEVRAEFVTRYWEQRLRLARRHWDEAMLCAAIRFIVEELGIHRIYYHSPVSGKRLKGVKDAPVSIYTDLPRRFCFEETWDLPRFVRPPSRKNRDGLWMYRLYL